jgi:hypothetical protein
MITHQNAHAQPGRYITSSTDSDGILPASTEENMRLDIAQKVKPANASPDRLGRGKLQRPDQIDQRSSDLAIHLLVR